MNHKHIARMFLSWFEQEAKELCVSGTNDREIGWDSTGNYVTWYRNRNGDVIEVHIFIRRIADQRLPSQDAHKVIVAAEELVSTETQQQLK